MTHAAFICVIVYADRAVPLIAAVADSAMLVLPLVLRLRYW
jgi:hypothetical protein